MKYLHSSLVAPAFIVCLVAFAACSPAVAIQQERRSSENTMPVLDATRIKQPVLTREPILAQPWKHSCMDLTGRYLAALSIPNPFDDESDKTIRVYDLTTGATVRESSSTEIEGELVAVARDTSQVAIETDDQLQIWDISGEHAALKFLLRNEAKYLDGYRWARFTESGRLLTCTAEDEKLEMWNTTNGEKLFDFDRSFARSSEPAFSPDLRYLYDSVNPERRGVDRRSSGPLVRYFDLSNGKVASQVHLQIDKETYSVGGHRLSPDGKLMATGVYRRGVEKSRLGIWNAQNGEPVFETSVPFSVRDCRWLDNDLILVKNYLFRVSDGTTIVDFGSLRPKHVVEGTGDLLFVHDLSRVAKLNYGSPLEDHNVLTVTKIPNPQMATAFADHTDREKVQLEAGDRVTVKVEMEARAPDRSFKNTFIENISGSLERAGYQVGQGAAVTLNVVVSERRTGETIDFGNVIEAGMDIRVGSPTSIPHVVLVAKMKLVDRAGNTLREFQSSQDYPRGKFELTRNQSISDYVRKWRWDSSLKSAANFTFHNRYFEFEIPKVVLDTSPASDWLDEISKIDSLATEKRRGREKFDAALTRRGTASLPDRRDEIPWTLAPFSLSNPGSDVLQTPLLIGVAGMDIIDVKFAFVNTALAAVLVDTADDRRLVLRYDLNARTLVASTPVENESRLLDYRPDGKVWMVTKGEDQQTLQVFQCTTDASKPEPDAMVADISTRQHQNNITQAWFSGAGKILAVDDDEKVAVYETVDGQLVYTQDVDTSYNDNSPVWVSADRASFLRFDQGRASFFNTADGSRLGELLVSHTSRRPIHSATFSADGSRVAILTANSLGIWDLRSGKLLREIDGRKLQGPVQWCTDSFILVKNKLVSLDLATIVWQYGAAYKDSPFFQTPGEGGWYVDQDSSDRSYLVRIQVPNPELGKYIDLYAAEVIEFVKRDDAIAVEVELGSGMDENNTGLTERMRKAVTDKLADEGFKTASRSLRKFKVKLQWSTESWGPKTLAFQNSEKHMMHSNGMMVATMSFVNVADEELPFRKMQIRCSSITYQIDWNATDPETDFQRQFEELLIERIRQIPFPEKIIVADDHRLGQSTLSNGNEVPSLSKKGKAISGQ